MSQTPWWKRGIIYQIYPRSFQDSNGDGIGDLNGIISRIDYLEWLGVDAIWLSPIYPSPMVDFGYDVSDYTDIDPVFGTLDDFENLIQVARNKNIRIILDFVPNHTSDQHEWFKQSRSSRDHPKRDWYIWRDGKANGAPPNNWLSEFGGSAWEYDRQTGQYYLHSFFKEQPDLNWRNPEVVEAMKDVLRFWLDKGVGGFRVDVIDLLVKDAQFRDDPPNPDYQNSDVDWPWRSLVHKYSGYQPEVHDVIRALRAVLDQYDDARLLIGELDYFLSNAEISAFYGNNDQLHLPFNFGLFNLPWQAQVVRQFVDDYDRSVPAFGWPVYVLSNHDRSRVASRIGSMQARCAALLMLTLKGTPFIYYGEELGMYDVPIPDEQVQDPWEHNVPGFGRDPVRTPLCWNTDPNAGFTGGQPWLPLSPDWKTSNVHQQQADDRSFINLYKRLIHLRKTRSALVQGTYHSIDSGSEGIFGYIRQTESDRLLVAINFTDGEQSLGIQSILGHSGQLVLSTYLDRGHDEPTLDIQLRPHEGCIIQLT